MSTLTILALVEMFDESGRPPDEIFDDVLARRRADIRLFVSANVRRQPRPTRQPTRTQAVDMSVRIVVQLVHPECESVW
jgi:hypothetical protein